jgi:hypothetical protein
MTDGTISAAAKRPGTRLRQSLGRVDPLTAAVGVVALIVYTMHGFAGFLSRDLGLFSYAGQQVVNGVPPYIGLLNRQGPLASLIPAIGVVGARVGGYDDLLGMRVLYMIISVLCVCLVYRLGRDLFMYRLAGLAAAAAFLSFYGFIQYASNGPREKTAMVLFLLLALLAVVKQRWLAAGVCLGLATLTWQASLLVGLPAVVIATFRLGQAVDRIRALASVAAGGLATALVFLVYYAAIGSVRVFLDCFVLINAKYAVRASFVSELEANWTELRSGYGFSLWVMIAGLVSIIVVALLAILSKSRRRDPMRMPVAGIGAATVAGLIWTSQVFDGWPDVFVLLPLAALGIGGLTRELVDRVSPTTAVSVTLVWVVAAGVAASAFSLSGRSERLDVQRASVRTVFDVLPDASVLSIEAPQVLVLSGRTNINRYQEYVFTLGVYMDETWPGGRKGYGKWVGREEPTILAVRERWVPPWLSHTVRTEYRRVGRAPGWVWYVHRSVGRADISGLRQRLRGQ